MVMRPPRKISPPFPIPLKMSLLVLLPFLVCHSSATRTSSSSEEPRQIARDEAPSSGGGTNGPGAQEQYGDPGALLGTTTASPTPTTTEMSMIVSEETNPPSPSTPTIPSERLPHDTVGFLSVSTAASSTRGISAKATAAPAQHYHEDAVPATVTTPKPETRRVGSSPETITGAAPVVVSGDKPTRTPPPTATASLPSELLPCTASFLSASTAASSIRGVSRQGRDLFHKGLFSSERLSRDVEAWCIFGRLAAVAQTRLVADQAPLTERLPIGVGSGVVVGEDTYTRRECYVKALTLNGQHAGAWYNLGLALADGGDVTLALALAIGVGSDVVVGEKTYTRRECFAKALTLDGQHAGAWYNLQDYTV